MHFQTLLTSNRNNSQGKNDSWWCLGTAKSGFTPEKQRLPDQQILNDKDSKSNYTPEDFCAFFYSCFSIYRVLSPSLPAMANVLFVLCFIVWQLVTEFSLKQRFSYNQKASATEQSYCIEDCKTMPALYGTLLTLGIASSASLTYQGELWQNKGF